jgi:ABC-type antimicrobial peptide transport system permease subunit
MVLGRAFRIVFWGILFGLAGVWVSTRIISSLLFGIEPLDIPTLLAGSGLLVAVGGMAALLPSLRGTRLSPVAALRTE